MDDKKIKRFKFWHNFFYSQPLNFTLIEWIVIILAGIFILSFVRV